MTSFFVEWELWQQMTFVLGCCIVIVFLIGLVKLWHNNRKLKTYEIIDEERRARIEAMKHCGIRHLSYSNVPFGVRAIERGVEVDGIWVAGSKSADTSQIASSATLAAVDDSNHRGLGGGVVYYSLEDSRDKNGESSSPAATHSPTPTQIHDRPCLVGYSNFGVQSTSKQHSPTKKDSEAYRPRSSGRPSLQISERSFTLSPQQLARHRPRSRALSLDSSTANNGLNTGQVYGSAQVYANRTHRRLNSGFEVHPAGTFGIRSELPPARPRTQSSAKRESIELQTKSTPMKLQKQRR